MTRIIRGEGLDLKQLREEAYAEGLARGREEGRAEAAALLARAQAERAREREGSSTAAVALAVELAARIVGEAARDPAVAARVAEEARRAAGGARPTLRVNPEDLPAVEASLVGCAFIADPAISRGGCVVETEWGRLDARLETQLERLAAALREALSEQPQRPGG
jgi:type III secretion protein L